MRLGTARVLALAVAKSTRSMLNAGMAGYDMREGQLWRHSVAAAVAAEVIPNYCDVELPPGAFTAAVLHDVGKLLMNRFLRADVVEFIHRAEKADHLERLEAEKVLLGVDHGELGGLMAQHWRLPDQIVLGIIYHHDPDAGNDIICDVTYLANLVAKNIEAGLDGRKGELSIHPSTAIRLGLRIPEIAQLCDSAATRYAQVCSRYNSA
jgi:HD-like signal output (HDOD) protein